MKREKNKSKFVGVRLSEEQNEALRRLQEGSNRSKSDVLMRGLELLSEYYSLGLNEPEMNTQLRDLEQEALHHAEAIRQIRKKEEAINQMVQELHNVEKILDKYSCDKNALIQILLDIQEQNHWLPKISLLWVSERLGIPWSQIYHIASFYKAFSLVPQGRHQVQVCLGTACQVRSAPKILDRVVEVLKIKPGETDPEQKFTLNTVNCLGCCALGPVVAIDNDYYSNPSVEQLKEITASYK